MNKLRTHNMNKVVDRYEVPFVSKLCKSETYNFIYNYVHGYQEHITEGASYLGNRISWKFAKHDLICKTTKWRVLIELTVHFYQA